MTTANALIMQPVLPTTNLGAQGEPAHSVVQLWRVFNGDAVGLTNTLNSLGPGGGNGLTVSTYRFFGLWVKAASSGVVAVTLNLLQSWDDVVADYVAPSTNSQIGTLASTTATVFSLAPSPMPWLRIQAVGTGANDASTTLTAYLFVQG